MISPKFVVVLAVIPAFIATLVGFGPFGHTEASAAASTPTTYSVKSLGHYPQSFGEASEPIAVNASGSVLFSYAGLLVSGATRRPAEPPASTSGLTGTMVNFAVNDSNQVVGQLEDTASAAYWSGVDGAAWRAIDVSALVPAGQSFVASRATVIDAAGEIAGYVQYHPTGSTSYLDLVSAGFFLSSPSAIPEAVPVPAGATGPAVITAMNSAWELVAAGGANYRVNRSTGKATVITGLQVKAISPDGTVIVGGGELHADGTLTGPANGTNGLTAYGISNGDAMLAVDTRVAGSSDVVTYDRTGTRSDLTTQSQLTLYYASIASNGVVVAETFNADGTVSLYLLTPGATTPPPVVNSTGDDPALKDGSVGCTTGNTVTISGASQPECTLRAAIEAENAGSESTKTITFSLQSGATDIPVSSALPAIKATGITIQGDGGTSTSIVIDGSALSGSTVGLHLSGASDTVTGVSFSHWKTAIRIDSTKGNDVVTANRIGVTTGTSDTGVQVGIDIENSPNNLVGGSAANQGNVISDLAGSAVYVSGHAASGNRILNNLLGTTVDGTIAQGDTEGVAVIDASKATIADNVVVANQAGTVGIGVGGTKDLVTGTVIQGNVVGLIARGTQAEPDSNASAFSSGIEVGGRISGAHVGGASAGLGNVVAESKNADIVVTGTSASGTSILGNLVGTDSSGMTVERYGQSRAVGIDVAGATTTTIGSSGAGANTVVGHSSGDVVIQPAAIPMTLTSTGASLAGTTKTNGSTMSTRVAGNRIGVFSDGTSVPADGTGLAGISDSGRGDTIGPGNIIDWESKGVIILGRDDTLEGNLVGVDGTGLSALPNSEGILVGAQSSGVRIGVPATTPNTISGNTDGLILNGKATVQNNLFGTTNLGNAAVTPYSGTLPADVQGAADFAPVLVYVTPTGAGSQIGGTRPGFGNVISGSAGVGLALEGHATVQGNEIGVGLDKTTVIPNTGYGIYAGAAGSLIGAIPAHAGDSAVAGGNLIEDNPVGVRVLTNTTGVEIASNTISGNGSSSSPGGGIQLESGADSGISAPTISEAQQDGTGTTSITIATTADEVGSLLQVFAATDCTTGAQGQGQTLLGGAEVTQAGELSLAVPLQAVGSLLTATATSPKHGTSVFAACVGVEAADADAIDTSTPGTSASLSDGTVTPGSKVTAIGTGFTSDERVRVTLHSTTVSLGVVKATSKGTDTLKFSIPKSLPVGEHHLVFTGLSAKRTASIAFEVVALPATAVVE